MSGPVLKSLAITLALLIGLAACNGGGTQLSGGGIGGSGISQGPITGFGSIFVNGVEFDTNNATILRDGVAVTQNDLRIGMVVTVEGNINGSRGTATTVTYAKELEGPIGAKPNANTLTVLGHNVIVDNLTRISVAGVASPTIDDLHADDKIEVSGFVGADGAIHATYIEVKPADTEAEVKGTVQGVSGTLLSLGNLQIETSGASLLGFNGRAPAVGDFIEVKGSSVVGTILYATTVKLSSRALSRIDAERAEVAGLVTQFSGAGDFVVGAQRVQTNAQTRYIGGLAASLQAGIRLEVEGSLANGILIATQVTFKDDLELAGNVLTKDATRRSLTLAGLPGITVMVNDGVTTINGAADFDAIALGQHVDLRGRAFTNSACGPCVLAVQLGVENGKAELVLQGPADVIAQPLLTVLGVVVDTSTIADANFSGNGISGRTSFFGSVRQGDIVAVEGTLVGGVANWQSVERDE